MSSGEVAFAMKTAAQLDLEQELRAGRDVTVELQRRASTRSGVSALGDSEGPSTSEAVDLLEETERLLAKMSNLSKFNASAVAGLSCDPPSNPDGIGLSLSGEAEEDFELNEMLAKAGQLSSMMQSISENISLNGNSNVHSLSVTNSKGDNSRKNSSTPAQLTPTTTDENSSYAGRRSLKQDPPGSVATKDDNNKTPSPASSIQRPTSAVHLPLAMMDDDVSSVGSASFRPYPRTESKSSRHFSPSFNPEALPEIMDTPQRPDSLLGVLPPKMELTGNFDSPDDVDVDIPSEPVCSKIPPTDLRADFDVMEASSRRNASEGAVQWEKVTTASPGEDDYVPMVDYSHMRPSSGNASQNNVESRLERHRRRSQARHNRRMRIVAVMLPVVVAAAAYYFTRGPATNEPAMVEITKEIEPLFQSFDTTLLVPNAPAEGFSFEGEDPSLVVTFPKSTPQNRRSEVVQEKPKRRGLFGRMKAKA
jgi:hypothetical protein